MDQATLDSTPGEEGNAGPVIHKVWGLTVERHPLLRAKQTERIQAYDLAITSYRPCVNCSKDKVNG